MSKMLIGGVIPPEEPKGPAPVWNEYPKIMIHPHAVKAEINPGGIGDAIRPSDRFPPVTVMNADQEAWHRAQGYDAGSAGDAAAFANAHAGPVADFTFEEWPCWKDGVLYQTEAEWRAACPPKRARKAA